MKGVEEVVVQPWNEAWQRRKRMRRVLRMHSG